MVEVISQGSHTSPHAPTPTPGSVCWGTARYQDAALTSVPKSTLPTMARRPPRSGASSATAPRPAPPVMSTLPRTTSQRFRASPAWPAASSWVSVQWVSVGLSCPEPSPWEAVLLPYIWLCHPSALADLPGSPLQLVLPRAIDAAMLWRPVVQELQVHPFSFGLHSSSGNEGSN